MTLSPRARRRVGWAAVLAALGGVVAALIVALPSRNAASPEGAGTNAPVTTTSAARQIHLNARDKRAIRATLARFVDTAVNRRNPGAAYDLATPNLRVGQTRTEWARGELPVYPYKSRKSSLDDWQLHYAYANEVSFDVMLQPAPGSKVGALAFTADFKRIKGRWFVDSLVPAASFAPVEQEPKVTAGVDFTPAGQRPGETHGRLGTTWLAVPLGILALIVLVPIVLILRGWLRDRAAYRAMRPL